MKLVSYWRSWHRMHSIRWGAASGITGILVAAIVKASAAAAFIAVFDFWITVGIIALVFVLMVAGALIDQPKLTEPPRKRRGNAGMGTS